MCNAFAKTCWHLFNSTRFNNWTTPTHAFVKNSAVPDISRDWRRGAELLLLDVCRVREKSIFEEWNALRGLPSWFMAERRQNRWEIDAKTFMSLDNDLLFVILFSECVKEVQWFGDFYLEFSFWNFLKLNLNRGKYIKSNDSYVEPNDFDFLRGQENAKFVFWSPRIFYKPTGKKCGIFELAWSIHLKSCSEASCSLAYWWIWILKHFVPVRL